MLYYNIFIIDKTEENNMSKEFLAFTYKIPSEPSKNRVYVWRMIKELGAVYLQQGVALLPYDKDLYLVLLNLREQVHTFKGKSTLSKLSFMQEEDEREIVDEFIKQIDGEYMEFIRNCQKSIDELEYENAQGDFDFSEITEGEQEYKKLKQWYDKITQRNYFKSEQQNHAAEILKKAKEKLQEYYDEVYRRDENNF